MQTINSGLTQLLCRGDKLVSDNIIVQTYKATKIYGDAVQVRALDEVDLTVREGEFLVVMGPSGSGKSTLLHLLGALDRPSSGQIVVNGQDLSKVNRLDLFRSKAVGFVFQLHNLIPTLTAQENVQVPLYETVKSRQARKERANELLSLVGLPDRLDHLPNQLSGGQRKKVAIARALANNPALVLADEPTGDLDSVSGQEIISLFRTLNQDLGTTIILVTHDSSIARQAQRVVTLRDGKILHDRPVASPYLEDLRDFKFSPLGQLFLKGVVPDELLNLQLAKIVPELARVLQDI